MSEEVQATKSQIVERLNLKPHKTCNGYFAETFRDASITLPRSHLPPNCKVDHHVSTCIYFLLPSGHLSYFHRTPCAQTFHFYLGEPLTVVELNEKDGTFILTCVGPDILGRDQQLQHTVPPNVWFGSIPTKDYDISSDGAVSKSPARDAENHYSLVGCTCARAFITRTWSWQNAPDSFLSFPMRSPSSPYSPRPIKTAPSPVIFDSSVIVLGCYRPSNTEMQECLPHWLVRLMDR